MSKRFSCTITFLLSTIIVFSQGELNTEQEIFFRNEKSLAIMLNTTGLGINGTYAKRIDAYKKTLYQFDIAEIKHPKEIKVSISSPTIDAGNSFVYGKLNKFFNIRASIGKQKEIYRKIDKGGISIRRLYSGGMELGLEKPVYYYVLDYQSASGPPVTVIRKFNTEPHALNYIEGNAPFFKGVNETKFVPGVFAKIAYMFEYGKSDKVLHAIEGGLIFDVYPRPINLMAHNNSDYFFVSMYIAYRIGKVVDSRFKTKKNFIDRFVTQ